MANDGSRWVTTDDISERDAKALEKLWIAREAILEEEHHTDQFEVFSTGDGVWHWYSGCQCSGCLFKVERLDIAQAELEVAYKSVAITSDVADGSMTEAWRRVKAWFEAGQKKAAKQSAAVQ